MRNENGGPGIQYTVVRVLFPDKTVLQGTFYSVEKGRKNELYCRLYRTATVKDGFFNIYLAVKR